MAIPTNAKNAARPGSDGGAQTTARHIELTKTGITENTAKSAWSMVVSTIETTVKFTKSITIKTIKITERRG